MTHSALQSALDYVFSFFERGYRLQTGRFDREVRRPDVFAAIAADHGVLPDPARTILVTGSKGKGSCARLIAAYLRQQGKKVGLVLTPEERHHLDRIRLDDQTIAPHDFLRLLDTYKPALDATSNAGETYYHPPTAIFLLIAIKHFGECGADYIVIEGGRGARYDEIGQLQAAVGVVTSILPEHLGKLGPSLRDICEDKFSLSSHCDALVCSQQAWQQAQECGAITEGDRISVVPAPAMADSAYPAWLSAIDALARRTVQALGMSAGSFPGEAGILASCQAITAAHSSALGSDQVVFLDGAVTADCLDFDYIRSDRCAPKAIVFGMSADKDAAAIAQAFLDHGYTEQFFFKAHSRTRHVAPLPLVSTWVGSFDTEQGLDDTSRCALLQLVNDYQRVYVVGVQIFLRSVRNALM